MVIENITIPPISPDKSTKVLFVCLGNICRSPAAEGVLLNIVDHEGTADEWIIDSAGTGNYHIGQLPDRRMRVHARARGIELTHHCRQVNASDFREFDLIIPMDAANADDLKYMAPDEASERKIIPMARFFAPGTHYDYVPDPYYEGAEGFELVLDLLNDAVQNLYDTVSHIKSSH